jgi:hypothetical protein
MVPVDRLVDAAEQLGGPPQSVEASRQRLRAVAQRQVESGRGTGSQPDR